MVSLVVVFISQITSALKESEMEVLWRFMDVCLNFLSSLSAKTFKF